MTKAYTYTAPDGYFAGAVEAYGLLPNNATYEAPEEIESFIPRWNGSAWEQVENHKGNEGYLDGQPYTIKNYGPLPEGWSDTPPEPTLEEVAERRKAEILARLPGILCGANPLLRGAGHYHSFCGVNGTAPGCFSLQVISCLFLVR